MAKKVARISNNDKATIHVIESDGKIEIQDTWKIGDIITDDSDRHSSTVFVSGKRKLVPNPDYSDAGYLTIPLELSSLFENAVLFYEDVLLNKEEGNVQIVLASDDKWIVEQFGSKLPDDLLEIVLSYSIGEFDSFFIQFDKKNHIEYSKLDFTVQDIIDLQQTFSAAKSKSSFIIWYSCEVEDMKKTNPQKIKKKLPKGWSFDSGGGGGGNLMSYRWIFQGPSDLVDDAIQIVKSFYSEGVYNFGLQKAEKLDHRISVQGGEYEWAEVNGRQVEFIKSLTFIENPFS